MEEIIANLKDSALLSAWASVISAICALLTFMLYLFSRKLSRRDMVDLLKIEILQVVSSVQGRDAWIKTAALSKMYDGGGVGPRTDRLAGLLGSKYQKKNGYGLSLLL
ncbi:MAG: hypothetical protein OXC79_10645 [Candidatus Poribacteria bacterium]|nr:hypothetical protein [Candidatus Poribacteria bacterium]